MERQAIMLDRLEFDPPGVESSDNAQGKKVRKSLRSPFNTSNQSFSL